MSGPQGSRIAIAANISGEGLAKNVYRKLKERGDIEVTKDALSVKRHEDTESESDLIESVKGADVFFICPFYPDPKARLYEVNATGDSLNYSFPFRKIAIPTYLGFMRSDWKSGKRSSINIREVAIEMENHYDYAVTFHAHSPQIQSIFRIPFDSFLLTGLYKEHINEMDLDPENTTVVSPDVGGTAYAEKFMEEADLKGGLAVVYKRRPEPGQSEQKMLTGDLEGRDVLIVDDMYGSFGTTAGAAKICKENGAKNIYSIAAHGLFSKKIKEIEDKDRKKELLREIPDQKTKFIETFDYSDPEDLEEKLQNTLYEEGMLESTNYRVVSLDTEEEKIYQVIPAEETARNSYTDRVITTNTIPRSEWYYQQNSDWLDFLKVGDMVAELIYRIHINESVSDLYKQ